MKCYPKMAVEGQLALVTQKFLRFLFFLFIYSYRFGRYYKLKSIDIINESITFYFTFLILDFIDSAL